MSRHRATLYIFIRRINWGSTLLARVFENLILVVFTEECLHCDRDAHCVGGHCICKHGFVGDGLDCWGENATVFQENIACCLLITTHSFEKRLLSSISVKNIT